MAPLRNRESIGGRAGPFLVPFAELTSDGAILNEYTVAGRYPGDLAFEEIELLDAEEAVAIVRQIRDLVIDRFASSGSSDK
jgi:hypothetical protein